MTEFRSRYNLLHDTIKAENKVYPIEFSSLRDGGSYFLTDNKELIQKMKSLIKEGADFYLFKDEPVEEPKVEEEEKKVDGNVIESVTNISEAKEYLRTLGIMYQKLNTPENIMAWAAKKNVVFPNLK